jgi:hypothetical protein
VRPGLSSVEGLRNSDGRRDHQCDCKRYRPHGISGQIPGGRSYINPDRGRISNTSSAAR